jgi:hypothetical protein
MNSKAEPEMVSITKEIWICFPRSAAKLNFQSLGNQILEAD